MNQNEIKAPHTITFELTDEQLAKFKAGHLEFVVSYADGDVRIESIEDIYGMDQ
jgi:hypothetical protein